MSIQVNNLNNVKPTDQNTIYKISDQNTTLLWDKTKQCWVQISNTVAAAQNLTNQLGLQIRFLGDSEFELYYNDIKFLPEGNTILARKLFGSGGSGGLIDSLPAEKVTYSNPLTAATNVKENLDEINSTLDGLADYLSTL